MTEGGNLQDIPEHRRFSATTLVRFRSVGEW